MATNVALIGDVRSVRTSETPGLYPCVGEVALLFVAAAEQQDAGGLQSCFPSRLCGSENSGGAI